MHTRFKKSTETPGTTDREDAWLESLRGNSRLRSLAEEVGIEFPEDSPPRFAGDLADTND